MLEEEITLKIQVGNYLRPVTFIPKGRRILCKFKYNKKLIAEIKSMEGAKYHGFDEPPTHGKNWSIANSQRNEFVLEFIKGNNPYSNYDSDIPPFDGSERSLMDHQKEIVAHGLARHYCIFACEMGTGKSLAAIEIMESITDLADEQAWYVGPKAGVVAVGRELVKWKSKVQPQMFTYEGFTKKMLHWVEGDPAPRIVIFDESSKLKNPSAKRSSAALHLADGIRAEWGDKGFVILMSGTPAPKTPVDWWHQCEVACPGFIKEGSVHSFKHRMCIIENRESAAGGTYPHVVSWLDDSKKCAVCGCLEYYSPKDLVDIDYHKTDVRRHAVNDREVAAGDAGDFKDHKFEASVNEVENLYARMNGLVLVKFKKDCLELPDKQYKIIKVKPAPETLRAGALIKQLSPRVITYLTLMRELSDGFQYKEVKGALVECHRCKGETRIEVEVPNHAINASMTSKELLESGFTIQEIDCDTCSGTGEVYKMETITEEVGHCPKDEVFIDLLDEHDDVGRFIVWGGFKGTIDRLTRMAQQHGWTVLRVDGRGYHGYDPQAGKVDPNVLLDCLDRSNPRFAEFLLTYPKVCFVGHPKAGGMALNLTASPTELFYSNDFDGEARMQAEDRFHRKGMDENSGATIIDLIHLKTDMLVLENLKNKKKLQAMSLGDLEESLKNLEDIDVERR